MSRHRWLLGLPLGLWLCWPLLCPILLPRRGSTLVVVFDGYHRLDTALNSTPRSQPLLLISCPLTGQPTLNQRIRVRRQGRWFLVLRQGFDSATQLRAVADWLPQPPKGLPPIGHLQLVSDGQHLSRLLPAAQVAVGGLGVSVGGLAADASGHHSLSSPWLIARDWWRLQFWRLSGSTGAFLAPAQMQRKQVECGLQR